MTSSATDEYDTLRHIWFNFLIGGTDDNTQHPHIAAALSAINQHAQTSWLSLNTSAGRTSLWSDLASTTVSSDVTGSYSRLLSMTLAYTTSGSQYQGNTSLLNDISSALDWMDANRYTPLTTEYDNRWDWVIGSPQALTTMMVLLYSQLTAQQIANYISAIDHFVPDPNKTQGGKLASTGANRADLSQVVILRGIVGKSSYKIAQGRDCLSDVEGGGTHSVFTSVTSGDGFYADGSFIQHTYLAYTGTYGSILLGGLARLMALLAGSRWAVTDPNAANIYQWVYRAFEPLIYQGAMMDMVRGRAISRHYESDHSHGHAAISHILDLISTASAADASHFKSMVKTWIENDTFASYYREASIAHILHACSIVGDSSVQLRPPLVGHIHYPNMARVVHRRPTFAFGISMSNSRIASYESINGENLRGWYTGDGMTYLYTPTDPGQYDHDFWATVNPYRLAGTTVDTRARANSSGAKYRSTSDWLQGAVLPGTSLGITGMNLIPWNTTLRARKTWVCLDDMIIALGAAITANSGRTIESIVENRRLSDANTEIVIVNGTPQPTALPWSVTISGVTWIHLSNTGGYYFPGSPTLNVVREARTGAWSNVNAGGPTTQVTRNYATIWYDHGLNPDHAHYAYVHFPGQSASETAAYAASPTVEVLQNDGNIQAIKETSTKVWAGNFWTAGTVDVVNSGSQSVTIIFRTSGSVLTVTVSDPTLTQTQLSVTINIAGYHSVVQADSHITVTRLGTAISFTVNVSSQQVASYTAIFSH